MSQNLRKGFKKKKGREFSLTRRQPTPPPPSGGYSREFIYNFFSKSKGQTRVVFDPIRDSLAQE